MERSYSDSASFIKSNYLLDPSFHLTGGFVGERDSQDAIGLLTQFGDEIGDSARQYGRFAAACSGNDQRRSPF